MKKTKNGFPKKAVPVICWLAIWELVAVLVHNDILLAGPATTIKALAGLVCTADFWLSIAGSLLRILLGFVLGALLGVLLGMLAGLKRGLWEFLKPLVTVMKSVPVASFVILLLIWFGNRNISVFICVIVTFPILYLNVCEGVMATDEKMLEMCRVFRVPFKKRVKYMYLPQLYPFLSGALKLSVGMSFKSGVAAEVIGQPLHTLGNGLYLAKIYLETGELFAWTVVIVLLAAGCEKLLISLLAAWKPGGVSHD